MNTHRTFFLIVVLFFYTSLAQGQSPQEIRGLNQNLITSSKKKTKKRSKKLDKKILPGLLWDTKFTTVFHANGTHSMNAADQEPIPLTYVDKVKIESALSNGNAANANAWGKLFALQLEEHFFQLSKNEAMSSVTFTYNVEN